MKILFFIALLINIIFFIWEVNSADLNLPIAKVDDDKVEKQILLVSELSGDNGESILIMTKNHQNNIHMDLSEENSKSRIGPQRIKLKANKSEPQVIKALSTLEEISKNKVTEDAFDKKGDVKRHVSKQFTNNTSVTNQIVSNRKSPQMSQKVLAGARLVGEKNEYTEEQSFWPDFSFIFDKEKSYSSQMSIKSNSEEFSLAAGRTGVGNSGLSASQRNWPFSIFGKPINNEDGISLNNELSETKEQVKKNYCYEVGPFENSQGIEKWRKSKNIKGTSLKRFKKNIILRSSYLVYHPAEETFEQSKKIARGYKKKQISDIWLFRKGDLRGAISFGLFRKEKSALRLQKKLIKNGLNVEIIERNKTQGVDYARIFTEDAQFKNTITISNKQTINECG